MRDENTPWLLVLSIAAASGLIYIGFLSSRYNFDGTVFALWLSQTLHSGKLGPLWHPRHIFYGPFGYLFCKLLLSLGINLSTILVLQIMDTLFAVSTLILFQIFCLQLTRDKILSAVFTLLLGFSFGFWFFAIEAEVQMPNTFFVLLSFFILRRWTGPEIKSRVPLRAAGLGILGALLMANHIADGLFLIPLGWAALLYLEKNNDASLAKRFLSGLAPALLMSIVVISLVAALYFFAYRQNPLAQGHGFHEWVIGLANPDTGLGYRKSYWALSPAAIPEGLRGFYRSFLADRHYIYVDQPWLSIPRAMALAAVIIGIIYYLISLPRLLKQNPRLHVLLLLFIIPMSGFSMIWEPANFEMKVALLPPLWLAIGVAASGPLKNMRAGKIALALLPLIFFINNFFGSIQPGSKPENNRDLQRAFFVRDHTEPDAAVYIAGVADGYNLGKIYLPYFALRETRVADLIIGKNAQPFPESLAASLERDRDRPLYALSELVEPGPAVDRLAKNHRRQAKDLTAFFQSRHPEPSARMPDGFGIYKLHSIP